MRRTRLDRQPLHYAAVRGNKKVVVELLLLLQYGANPNSTDKYGYTPERLASRKGHEEMVQLLQAHSGRGGGIECNLTRCKRGDGGATKGMH